MCACPRTAHRDGDGPCSCGCPAYRPVRVGTELEDDAHDLIHQEAVDGLLAEHTLTSEVVVLGDAGEVWIDLPDLPAAVCPHGDPTCPCPDGLACHYQGADPMPCPTTGIVGCTACRMAEGLADTMGEEEA